ncbi:MAG: acetyl-CoA C-acyltransferase [Saprospiraceae bacterium]|nr:acetyl-CoA C-acyltransferase [Saprospiraceae bacterium]MCF8252783.1 acetyl-CoA C-acyltransferase [Saprospiraceae bacterium]MCF8283174.1 acetyl-CoA C-acyltransferase [Bacteroidales bacterium]MCF8314338.1 acetyl-CoA C-acyltransferase [Saprospiraceae bacterium]MCF8443210.1 acetyl-CoA C-acyltransferase [Saprospiraceae bacterium]
MQEVFIVSAVRTPIGSFGGVLSSISATALGAVAIRGALAAAGVSADQIEEAIMGNVVSANLGQAPARQAARAAGIPDTVPCTTVNKVCASGMKSIMFGAQSIMLGHNDVVLAGGMENMSQIPYYVPNARWGYKYGDGSFVDGLAKDGLQDVYDQCAMGVFADRTGEKYEISREAQDAFAIDSYKRAAAATEAGFFKSEIVPVSIPQRKGDPLLVSEDEEFKKVMFEKIPGLRPAFTPNGTVTAANASTINDGASALVLVSGKKLKELNLKPLARIVAFADAEQEPAWFTTTPAVAAPKALKRAGLTKNDIDFYEVNEAFSVVTLAFEKLMDIRHDQTNVFGGAVSLGHPLGASGARIVTTLNNVLQQRNGRYGLAAICNGGGGASALILERV